MGFLRGVVEQLLDGVDTDNSGSQNWTQLTTLGFKRTNDVEFWSPYLNQPFSAPPLWNIDNLLSLARTRLDAAGDHLWLLQTDPAYMRYYIKIQSEGAYIEGSGENRHTTIFQELVYGHWTYLRWQ